MAFELFKGQQTRANEWPAEHDAQVLAKLVSDQELAERFGRTPKAVRVRRWQLRQRYRLRFTTLD